jgi:glycosyltransferase involved in cell wall biosynthesis
MRIGIDARFLTHPQPGGFKTYTESLVSVLARIDTENEYFLYTDRDFGDRIDLLANPNFHGRIVPATIPSIGVPWREQVSLARQVVKNQLDLFHSPCLTAPLKIRCPLVVTVHDMIWAFPEKYSHSKSLSVKRRLMELYNRSVPKYAIRRANAIITVSHAARKSIEEHMRLKNGRLFVTHEAPNPLFKQVMDERAIAAIRARYNLPERFILAIGSADPRKNIRGLAQAYSLLPYDLKEQFRLVVVWTHSFLAGELSAFVDDLQISDHVHFLGNVSNEDLMWLYNIAALFAFPSLYEGFGLPPLEAMACGAPVIAADNSSIPEIVDDAALLFNAEDVNEISSVMKRALMNDSLRSSMSKKGLERVVSFSWERCGRETLAVYEDVLRLSRSQ